MLPISMLRFKNIIFHQNSPKIKLFLQKNANFSSAGGSAPRPPTSFRISDYAPEPNGSQSGVRGPFRVREALSEGPRKKFGIDITWLIAY